MVGGLVVGVSSSGLIFSGKRCYLEKLYVLSYCVSGFLGLTQTGGRQCPGAWGSFTFSESERVSLTFWLLI